MTPKILIIRLVIIAIIVIILFISFILFGYRLRSVDLTKYSPYSEEVGKTVVTKNVSYLVETDDKIHPKKYTLKNKLRDIDTISITLPIGTKLMITDAKNFSRLGRDYISNPNLLGKVSINSLQKEVEFGYRWGKKEYLPNGKYYMIYKKTPWQEKALPYKYGLEKIDDYNYNLNNTKEPYNKNKADKQLEFISIQNDIRSKGQINFERLYTIDTTQNFDSTFEIIYKFKFFNDALDNFDYTKNIENKTFFLNNKELNYLGLNTINMDLNTTKVFPIGYVKLSENFKTKIMCFVKDEKINTKLFTLNKNYKIIDTLTLFELYKGEKTPRKHTKYNKRLIQIFSVDKSNHLIKDPFIYKVDEQGKIKKIE